MSKRIKLSKKHGVNAGLIVCAICGTGVGIALHGRLKGDAEAPRKCVTGELCKDCSSVIADGGFMLIKVRDGETGNNPYRSGSVVGVTADSFAKVFNNGKKVTDENAPHVRYVEASLWDKVGLPNGEDKNE